jgi:hypothetical protein
MINILGAIAWSLIMRYVWVRSCAVELCDRVTSRNDNHPYENMNITGIKGLTDAEISTLKALGAVEDGEM